MSKTLVRALYLSLLIFSIGLPMANAGVPHGGGSESVQKGGGRGSEQEWKRPRFARLRALFISKTKNPREYWEYMLLGGLSNSREKAIQELEKIADPRSVPILIKALKDSNGHVRWHAVYALVKIGEPAVPALIEALKDSNEYVRRYAAYALGNIGEKAAAAVPALIEALKDSNEYVRGNAAGALGNIGEKAAATVPALIEALKDSNEYVRGNAAGALGNIGEKAAATVPALIEALKDSDASVRWCAAGSLEKIRKELATLAGAKDATAETIVDRDRPTKEHVEGNSPPLTQRPESMVEKLALAYKEGKRLFIDREKILGEGNLKVYEGFLETNPETREGHLVAIKMGESEDLTYLRRQQAQQGKIGGPHVIKVYGIYDDPDKPFLVMEHVAGKTLRKRLKAGEILYDEAIRIAYEIAKGLEAAHKEGIVHGDLKPENILLDGECVKLTDFEGDTPIEGAELSRSLRSRDMGGQIATLAYMAPEQRQVKPTTDKSDIYAWGTILYEMVNGELPESDRDDLIKETTVNAMPEEMEKQVNEIYGDTRNGSLNRPAIKDVVHRLMALMAMTAELKEAASAEAENARAAARRARLEAELAKTQEERRQIEARIAVRMAEERIDRLEEKALQQPPTERPAIDSQSEGAKEATAQPSAPSKPQLRQQELEIEPASRKVLLEGETEGAQVRHHRNDSGKIYIPFSDTILRLVDHWREGRAEEERKGVPLDTARRGGSFAGSLTKFSLAVVLKEAMKEELTGKETNFSHIFSDEQVVGYGAFSATAALGESLSVRVGDGIASRTGLKAFSSKAPMISPYRLGSYAFFMTLGMQADQIARMTLAGMKDHKEVAAALSEALHIWWSQFEMDEAVLTTAGFLAAKPLISPFVRAVQSRWIQSIRNLQKSVRWGHRGLKVLEGATGNLTFMVIEEAIVLLTVDILMEEYVEWKKEGELKEKVGSIFKQLEGEVQKITKDNARESAANMAALFEELRAVRVGVIHTEEGKVKDKYEAFQKALNELLDHKSGMFWKDTKAMVSALDVRKSLEYEACVAMHKEAFGGGDYDGSQFERNYLCNHLAFLKIWVKKLESVKKRYAEYQLAYATSENRKNHKKTMTFDFLKDFDLDAVNTDSVFNIKYSNIRDIYQLEQSYYELALQKIAKKFSGDDMKAISDAINPVKEESMAGEIVFETSAEQIKEEDVKAELERPDLMPVILAEIVKEDHFWIELGVGAKNGDGIFSTFNPKRIHVMNDVNCVLSEMLGVSDDVVSLETRDERAWLSCDQFVELPLSPNEYRRRETLGSFIDVFFTRDDGVKAAINE